MKCGQIATTNTIRLRAMGKHKRKYCRALEQHREEQPSDILFHWPVSMSPRNDTPGLGWLPVKGDLDWVYLQHIQHV